MRKALWIKETTKWYNPPMQTVKVQLCGSPIQTSTDVHWFLLQVRVRTEANQLTVNKWSPSFYWVGERKRECRSTSSGRYIHTHKHMHKHKWWLMYYMPLKSDEERTACSHIYRKGYSFRIPDRFIRDCSSDFIVMMTHSFHLNVNDLRYILTLALLGVSLPCWDWRLCESSSTIKDSL